jgi:DNA polymerase-4
MSDSRTILHVDMDAFFASVEQRDYPELKGKPVVVGGSADQRGVVSAASYEARVFGIRSAMPLREAKRRCPEAIFRPVRMSAYKQASRAVFAIFDQYTPWVQPLSVDEAFLDVTGVLHLWHQDPVLLAEAIRKQIRQECQLTASVGIAANKFLAKLASDMDKPDGLTRVPFETDAIRRFLAPLPVGRLWGVGKKSEAALALHGFQKVEDLQAAGREKLIQLLGESSGAHLFALAMGEDERPVEDREVEKSISAEHTYSENQSDPKVLHQTLLELSEKVGRRLRAADLWACCVQIKIRSERFETFTRQRMLQQPIRRDLDILHTAHDLLLAFDPTWPVRLLGVGVSHLQESGPQPEAQLDLFAEPKCPESTRLDETVDQLRARYGRDALKRGHWSSPER